MKELFESVGNHNCRFYQAINFHIVYNVVVLVLLLQALIICITIFIVVMCLTC